MANKTKIIFLVLISTIAWTTASAQCSKAEALYIDSFTKSLTWPDELRETCFILTILGPEDEQLKKVFLKKKKKVGNLPVRLKFVDKPEDITKSHMLYVPMENSALLPQVVELLKESPTVIVTNTPGFKSGPVINLDPSSFDLEINALAIENKGLKISPNLLSMAIEL